jgi:hypothetical protein
MSLRPCEPDTQHIDRQRHPLVLDDACIASTLASAKHDSHRHRHTRASARHYHQASCADWPTVGLIEDRISVFVCFCCVLLFFHQVREVLIHLPALHLHHRAVWHVICLFFRHVLSRAMRLTTPIRHGGNGNSVLLLSVCQLSSQRHGVDRK